MLSSVSEIIRKAAALIVLSLVLLLTATPAPAAPSLDGRPSMGATATHDFGDFQKDGDDEEVEEWDSDIINAPGGSIEPVRAIVIILRLFNFLF